MPNRILLAAFALACTIPAQAERQLLWGDTHRHSNLSTDAYINQNFTASPGMDRRGPSNGAKCTPRPAP